MQPIDTNSYTYDTINADIQNRHFNQSQIAGGHISFLKTPKEKRAKEFGQNNYL